MAFLAGSLEPRWRDRYVAFVSREKTQHKFIETLNHTLLDRFDSRAARI